MLLQLGVNDSLVKCHSLARRIPGSAVVWNGSKYEVAVETNFQIKLWAALMTTGGFFLGLNARTAWRSGDVGMAVLCGFFSFVVTLVAATSLTFRQNNADCAAFLNGLLSIAYDRRNDTDFQGIVRPTALVKLMSRMLIAIEMLYPWVFSFVALAWPCSPFNLLSSLVGWCCDNKGNSGSNMSSWLARVVVRGAGTVIPHLLFWKAYFSNGVIYAVHIFLGSLCQQMLLEFMSGRGRTRSDFPSQLKLYRSCQILNACFSNYCSSVGLVIIMVLVVAEISMSYLVLKILAGSGNFLLPIKLTMILSCLSAYLFHMMAVGEAAAVNTMSLSILTKGKQTNAVQFNRKLTRRQIRAAWPLKIKIGESSFIEAGTTLVMLDFTLRRLVDLLLIGA